jgi:hypothetical protein
MLLLVQTIQSCIAVPSGRAREVSQPLGCGVATPTPRRDPRNPTSGHRRAPALEDPRLGGNLYGTGLTTLSIAFAISFWLGLALGAVAGERWLRSTPPATG